MKSLIIYFKTTIDSSVLPGFREYFHHEDSVEIIVNYIKSLTNSEVFEIERKNNYSNEFRELYNEMKEEYNNKELPELKAYLDNIDNYDVIYIGSPVFYKAFPQTVFSLLSKLNFEGKKIRPFYTRYGFLQGDVVEYLKKICVGAKILPVLEICSSQVETSYDLVETWVKEKDQYIELRKNVQLESMISEICDELYKNRIIDIKKSILNSSNNIKELKEISERELIKCIFERANEIFDFEKCRFSPGQPYPNESLSLLHSKKYDFYYCYTKIYDDFEFVGKLLEDGYLEILFRNCDQNNSSKRKYIYNPIIADVETFEKPKMEDVVLLKMSWGFYELLERVCHIDTTTIKEIVNRLFERINGLSLSAKYYIQKDNSFKKELFDKVFAGILENYSEKEINVVYKNLSSSPYLDSIIRMLTTYNYTNELYSKYPNDYLDLTFIVVSLFKIVEVLFCKFLNDTFSGLKIKDLKGNTIDLSNKDLTLGAMKQIFYSKNVEIKNFLREKAPYSDKLKRVIEDWIKVSRNGFLHKHSIECDNRFEISALNSLDIIFFLVLTFEWDN